MALPTTWIDEAFLFLCAECFSLEVEYRAVDDEGAPSRSGVLRPARAPAIAGRVVLALWMHRHYAAILLALDPSAQPSLGIGGGVEVSRPSAAPQPEAAAHSRTFLRRMAASVTAPPRLPPQYPLSHQATVLASADPQLPLTSPAEVRELLRSEIPPVVSVAMEFSGSLRTAFEARGIVALSADLRPCEVGGLHFQGDVRDIIGLARRKMVVFFPNCF